MSSGRDWLSLCPFPPPSREDLFPNWLPLSRNGSFWAGGCVLTQSRWAPRARPALGFPAPRHTGGHEGLPACVAFSSPSLFIFWFPAHTPWLFPLSRVEEIVRNNHFDARGPGNYCQALDDEVGKMGLTHQQAEVRAPESGGMTPRAHVCVCVHVCVSARG